MILALDSLTGRPVFVGDAEPHKKYNDPITG
jgi:hypothetical protein